MKSIIIKLLLSAIIVLIGDYLMDSVTIENFGYAIVLVVVLGFLNSFVKPILKLFSLPLTIITLGLFSFVITAIIILLADFLMGTKFETNGFWSALGFSLIIGILNSFADRFILNND